MSGDSRRQALAGLFDAHGARLYRYALVLVGSVRDAEDVVQEVFVRLARLDGLASLREPQAYLFRSVRNEAASCLRRRRRRARREAELDGFDVLEPRTAEAPDPLRRRCLARALARLPAKQREAVALHAVDGLTFAEIGRLLGESPNTMASRYRLAVARLTEWLGRE